VGEKPVRLNRESSPLRDYHKAKRLMWDPQDIRFDQDRRDWDAMSFREQELVRRALTLFLGGEAYVTHDLAPLLIALRREGGHLEEEMFLTAQLFEESKHVEFFADVLEQVVTDVPDLADIAGDNYCQLFDRELAGALDRLLTDSSRRAQAEAVVTYHMIVEGTLAETGYYGIFNALQGQSLMPGLLHGLELVQRDEARHIGFGLHLLQRYLYEDPTLWDAIDTRINALFPLAAGIFSDLFAMFLPDIPFGLELSDVIEFAGSQFTARMKALQRVRL